MHTNKADSHQKLRRDTDRYGTTAETGRISIPGSDSSRTGSGSTRRGLAFHHYKEVFVLLVAVVGGFLFCLTGGGGVVVQICGLWSVVCNFLTPHIACIQPCPPSNDKTASLSEGLRDRPMLEMDHTVLL